LLSHVVVHLVHQSLPGARVALLALAGRELWVVADRDKPDAGEHAACLLREEAPALLERQAAEDAAGDELAERRRRRLSRQARGRAVAAVSAALAAAASWGGLAATADGLVSAVA
jgi:hypothetical protein